LNYRKHYLLAIAGRNLYELADATGMAESTLRRWRDGKAEPGIAGYIAVMQYCGYELKCGVKSNV